MTDRSFEAANAAASAELARLVASLAPEDLTRDAGDGWTVGVVLGHLACWDRLTIARWRRAQAAGAACPEDLPTVVADLVNEALLPTWLALAANDAATLVLDAAVAVDELVAALPDASVEAAFSAGRGRLVDRSLHRREHLEQLERALRGGG